MMDEWDKIGCRRAGSIRPGSQSVRLAFTKRAWVLLLACLLIGMARPSAAYSLLTHEELIDILWKDQIEPLLLKRFPAATNAQLHQAHAYAYGGCLIQDLGYYPFGSKFFSDLTHYVRSGDFILNMIRESQDLNEDPAAVRRRVAGRFAAEPRAVRPHNSIRRGAGSQNRQAHRGRSKRGVP